MISVQYIPLSVRVRAWNLSLLSSQEIEQLLTLDSTSIMNYIASKEKEIVTTNTMEFHQSLYRKIATYINIAARISSAEGQHFIRELYREFEINNLKLVVRMLCSGKFQESFSPITFSPQITERKLLEIRTFQDLISMLSGTLYEPFLTSLNKVEQEKNSLYWETALDNLYTHNLSLVSKRLDPQSKDSVKKLMIRPIMQEQLVDIYRYRFHYHADPNETLLYVPNTTNLLTMEEWKKIIFSPTPEEFYQYLKVHNLIDDSVTTNASALRLYFRKKTEKMCRQALHKRLVGITSFVAFIQLKKIQVQKISTIMESKMLKTFTGDISAYL